MSVSDVLTYVIPTKKMITQSTLEKKDSFTKRTLQIKWTRAQK